MTENKSKKVEILSNKFVSREMWKFYLRKASIYNKLANEYQSKCSGKSR